MSPAQVGNSQRALARGILDIPLTWVKTTGPVNPGHTVPAALFPLSRLSRRPSRQWSYPSLWRAWPAAGASGRRCYGKTGSTWPSRRTSCWMAPSMDSSLCWNMLRMSWGWTTWWLAYPARPVTRISSETSCFLDLRRWTQGMSFFHYKNPTLLASCTPSRQIVTIKRTLSVKLDL